MRPLYRWLAVLAICVFALLLIVLSLNHFRTLLTEYGEAEGAPYVSLPLSFVIPLILFPVLALLFAALLTLRAILRIRRKESEEKNGEEDEL